MRILVTGAAGFLGSHLVDSLLADNHEVIGLDNFYTGDKSNLRHLSNNGSFELIRHDITSPIFLEVDAIANLACPASPIHYQKHPVQTIKTSVLGVTNMLEIAARLSIPILQASTSEVYGDPSISPQPESYWGNVNPIGIRACYDEGKRVAETLLFDFHRQYGVEIKVARIFNTYGQRMKINDGRVVSNFIVQALRNEPITVYGDGSQSRSFCFQTDLIKGLKTLLFSDSTITGPINLGNPVEFTMLELAQKIIAMTNSSSKLIFESLPQDDPKQRQPQISEAIRVLGWRPVVSLEEGLKLTIADFAARI